MSEETLIKKEFTFGDNPFSSWYSHNSDVQHLVLHGVLENDDYEDFKSVDILDPKRGVIILDMGDCLTLFTFWDYYCSFVKENTIGCSKIIFPQGIKNIHINTDFYNLFEEVVLPSTIENIYGFSFYRNKLREVIFPNGLKSLHYKSFAHNLMSYVHIPDSCDYIEGYAFGECPNLTDIHVDDSHPNFCTIDGSLYSKDGTKLIQAASGIEHLVIAEGTKKVCEDSLGGSFAKSITFPSTLEHFENADDGITYNCALEYYCQDIYVHEDCCEELADAIQFELEHSCIKQKPRVHIID